MHLTQCFSHKALRAWSLAMSDKPAVCATSRQEWHWRRRLCKVRWADWLDSRIPPSCPSCSLLDPLSAAWESRIDPDWRNYARRNQKPGEASAKSPPPTRFCSIHREVSVPVDCLWRTCCCCSTTMPRASERVRRRGRTKISSILLYSPIV